MVVVMVMVAKDAWLPPALECAIGKKEAWSHMGSQMHEMLAAVNNLVSGRARTGPGFAKMTHIAKRFTSRPAAYGIPS